MNYGDDQSEVFLTDEADQWFIRNMQNKPSPDANADIALKYLKSFNCEGKHIVELGCADGWRLAYLSKWYNCRLTGVDPSEVAVVSGRSKFGDSISLLHGTAAHLELPDDSADILVHGFYLYLCSRSELFRIAYEADRVLKDGGVMLVVDFFPAMPYRNPYHYKGGLFSYKMNYSEMFLWNPDYTLEYHEIDHLAGTEKRQIGPDTRFGLSVLRKQRDNAYPVSPYGR